MEKVRSADGTAIAYDRSGDGPPIVLVTGAFGYRNYPKSLQIAELLSKDFTVYNYDRRGRGDSGDTAPWSVQREIEDLDAVIDAAGGSAYVWGMSSGAVLSLRAAAAGLNIKKLAVYQPPFIVDTAGKVPPPDFAQHLGELLATDRRGDAVYYFMVKGMGAPGFFIGLMRLFPVWQRLKGLAHTLPYDFAMMGDTVEGKPLSAAQWSVTVPTLVMDGEKAPQGAHKAAKNLTEILPDSQYHSLPGQGIDVKPEVLVPALVNFFTS